MANRQEITVVATKRSGHHAFIEWICQNLNDSFIYLNNIPLRRDELYVKFLEEYSGYGGGSGTHRYDEYKLISPERVAPYSNVLFSYENHPLKKVLGSDGFAAQQRLVIGSGRRKRLIVFVRDPVNTFASFLKVVEANPAKLKQFSAQKRAWVEHARWYLGMMTGGAETLGQFTTHMVSYNRFIRSDAYREALARELGLGSSTWSRSLSRFGGGGNTFFDDKVDYQASADMLENRWQELKDKRLLRDAFQDEQLYSLSLSYYRAVGLEESFGEVLGKLRSRHHIATE